MGNCTDRLAAGRSRRVRGNRLVRLRMGWCGFCGGRYRGLAPRFRRDRNWFRFAAVGCPANRWLGFRWAVRQRTVGGPRCRLSRRPWLALGRRRGVARFRRFGRGGGRLDLRRLYRRNLGNFGRLLQAFQRVGSAVPNFAQLGERSAGQGQSRHVEDRFSEGFGGVFAPLVPMRDVLTQRFPGLGDSRPSVGPQADECPSSLSHAAHRFGITCRVEHGVKLADVVETLDEIPALDADSFECLTHLIEGPTDWRPVQKVVPLFIHPVGHVLGGGFGRRHGGLDLPAQRFGFPGEVVDHRFDVVGDPLDLVFVFVGQEIPDLFDPGQRIADAGQQIQDRRVDLVDLCRVAIELRSDHLALLRNAACGAGGIGQRFVDGSNLGNLLPGDGGHRAAACRDLGRHEVDTRGRPRRRSGAQLCGIACGPDHSDIGRDPAPARRCAATGTDGRRRRSPDGQRPGHRRRGQTLCAARHIRHRLGDRIVVCRHPHAVADAAQPIAGAGHRLDHLGRRTVVSAAHRGTYRIVTGHTGAAGQRRGQGRDHRSQRLARGHQRGAGAV